MRGIYTALLVVWSAVAVRGGDNHWPPQVPEPAGWTYEASGSEGRVARVKLANAEIEYALYSSPQRPMLYELSNYTVTPRSATGVFARQVPAYRSHETVVWLHTVPGTSDRVFVRQPRRSWRTLRLVRTWRWEELPKDSAQWSAERGIALRLWSVHALIRSHGRDPLSMMF